MNVVILTPLPLEFRAVERHLSNSTSVMRENALYKTGQFKGRFHSYTVTLRETGAKNSVVALAAERAIRLFEPSLIFLSGIAAGVKDVQVGDVVVGIRAYGYESGKETADGPVSRPDVLPFSPLLIETARLVSREDTWQKRTPDGASQARVFFGPIASGDKVIATTASPLYQYLKLHYNDTTALEMESIGFATAAAGNPRLAALNIRGISDLMDQKGDDFQEKAAERAAAFLFELLYQLEYHPAPTETRPGEQPQSSVTVTNSKNVIVGGNFTVAGNFHLGDSVIHEATGAKPPAASHEFTRSIQEMISKGRANEAIEQLVSYTSASAPGLKQDMVLLSDRWNQLARKTRLGLISNSEANLERNQIVAGVLELLNGL